MRLTLAALLLAPALAFAGLLDEPIPGAIAPATKPTSTVVDGVRVTMVTAVSKKDAASLKAHYAQRLTEMKLYMAEEVADVTLPNALQVTAVDTDNMVSYTVLLQKGASNTTTVILSTADLGHKVTRGAATFAPVMPGAQGVSSATMEGMQTLSYSTVATPAEVKAFYREQLTKLGFKEQEELVFGKANERIAVMVSPGLSMRSVMLVHEPNYAAPELTTLPAATTKRDGGR